MTETGAKLRSPQFASVQFTAPTGGLTRGQMYKHNSLVGVIVDTVDAGEIAVMIYKADKIVCPKRAGTGITFAIGDKVYYRAASNNLTNATTSNTLCGRCLVAAGATDTEVEVDLNGAVVA